MRALIRGERVASVGVMLGLFALFCVLASSLVLTLGYRAQVEHFKQDFYQQCVSRLAYDKSSQAARAQSRIYYEHMIANEEHNRFIDERLRAQRVADAREMVAALTDTLNKTVPGGCSRYR